MLFTQSDFYVNFARIHPNLLHQDGGRIRMARPDNVAAVGMFIGLCTNGLILKSELIGPLGGQYGVHGITVAGAEQDTRRFEALLGAVLKYDSITGNVNERGISFYTRGQGKNGSFGNPSGMFLYLLIICYLRLVSLQLQHLYLFLPLALSHRSVRVSRCRVLQLCRGAILHLDRSMTAVRIIYYLAVFSSCLTFLPFSSRLRWERKNWWSQIHLQ